MFSIVSVQGGFIFSVAPGFELSLNGSVDGLLGLLVGNHQDFYNNSFGHSINFGLIFDLK
jgi:hypothetical protein